MKRNKPKPVRVRVYPILGHASTRVIHWMAAQGATLSQVQRMLRFFGLLDKIKPENLRYRYNAGRDPRRTRPANISSAVEKKLRRFMKGGK